MIAFFDDLLLRRHLCSAFQHQVEGFDVGSAAVKNFEAFVLQIAEPVIAEKD